MNYNGVIYKDLSETRYCIYKLYSNIEEDNCVYIGFTGDPIGRWKQHANNRKYDYKNGNPELYNWMTDVIDNKKQDIIFSIIAKDLTKEEASQKEIEYIEEYKNLKFTVLNKTIGGIGQRGAKYTIKSREVMSIARKQRTTQPQSKKVYVTDLTTGEILEFISAVDCSKNLLVSYSTITNRCNQNNLTAYRKKYVFSYIK